MEWYQIWRHGLAPQLSVKGLEALREALLKDDPFLIQGSTTSPPAMEVFQDAEVEAACALGYCLWKGDSKTETVGDVIHAFERTCIASDDAIGREPAISRLFLNWFDSTPRNEMRRLLLKEVTATLKKRTSKLAYNYSVVKKERPLEHYVPPSKQWDSYLIPIGLVGLIVVAAAAFAFFVGN